MQDDWPLIESSFLKQYGVRLRAIGDMPYSEFCSYLAGLMPDTPLGNIVRLRSETDESILKNFTPEQKQIRNEWMERLAGEMPLEQVDNVIKQFELMFRDMAEGGD